MPRRISTALCANAIAFLNSPMFPAAAAARSRILHLGDASDLLGVGYLAPDLECLGEMDEGLCGSGHIGRLRRRVDHRDESALEVVAREAVVGELGRGAVVPASSRA